MACTTSLTYSYSGPGGTIGPTAVTSTGNTSVDINRVVANGTANIALPSVIFTAANLQSCYIYCSGGNLTLKTNNATVPSAGNQVLSLVANSPISWASSSGANNPITADVTGGMFAQNLSGANVTLQAEFLFN